MKVYSFAIILILWPIIVGIYGQKTVMKSRIFDTYSDDISYDGIQNLNFEDVIKTEEPPEKIGELEFEVEVAEQTPDSRQMAPEVLVFRDKPRNENRKKGKDSEVITEVPVDMMGSSQIGDIELDIEVEDQKTTKYIDNFQKLTQELSNSRAPTSQLFSEEKIAKEFPSIEESSSEIHPMEEDIELADKKTKRPKMPKKTKGIKNFANLPEGLSTERQPTEEEQEEVSDETSEWPDTRSTSKPQESSIWPIILVAIVFNILIIIGIIWAITRFCMVMKKTEEQEKTIEVLKAADIEKNAKQPPPPQ